MKYPAKQIFERNRGNLARLHVIVFDEMNKKQLFSYHYYAL